MNDLAKEIVILVITAFTGGFFGWFFTRRKQNAEATGSEIDNGSKVVELYKEALDDLPIRYEKKFIDLDDLFLQKEKILKEEIEFLKRERDLWKKKYNDLLKEYNKYKKEHP